MLKKLFSPIVLGLGLIALAACSSAPTTSLPAAPTTSVALAPTSTATLAPTDLPPTIAPSPTMTIVPTIAPTDTALPSATSTSVLSVVTPTLATTPTIVRPTTAPTITPTSAPTQILAAACNDTTGRIMSISSQGKSISNFTIIPTIAGDSSILTTSDRPDLQYWKIEFSGDDRKTWASIATGTQRFTSPQGPLWKTGNVPDGDYWIRSVMVNKAGNFSDPCEIKIIVKNSPSTSVAPTCKDASASIIAPRMDAVVSQRVSVNGSADNANFSYYQLQYSSDRKTWVDTGIRSRTPLANGTLGIWDATALPDGDYWLRVLVVDKSSNYQTDPCQVHVVLKNNSTGRSTPLCGTSSVYIAWLQIIPPAGSVVTIKTLQPPPVVSDMLGFFGSVNAPDFARYVIQYSTDQKTWIDTTSSSTPQLSETGIGGWQTRQVPNGNYWVHLRVVNKSGNYQDYCEMNVTVKN